jgi:hypothetical protein
LASNRRLTARSLSGLAARPYTVSVGNATKPFEARAATALSIWELAGSSTARVIVLTAVYRAVSVGT